MEYEFLCKTFRCCIDEECCNCPLYDFEIEHCEKQIKLQALAFIIRQQAEIERLKQTPKCVFAYDGETLEYCVEGPCPAEKTIETIRAEAVREFAERLKKRLDRKHTIYGREYVLRHMRELVKEMTEEKK